MHDHLVVEIVSENIFWQLFFVLSVHGNKLIVSPKYNSVLFLFVLMSLSMLLIICSNHLFPFFFCWGGGGRGEEVKGSWGERWEVWEMRGVKG